MQLDILTLAYIIGSVTFILGLKMLSNPLSARKGNLIAAGGMSIAIFSTIFLYETEDGQGLHNYVWIFSGLIIGSIVGTLAAKKSEDDSDARNGKYVQWNGWCLCCIDLCC